MVISPDVAVACPAIVTFTLIMVIGLVGGSNVDRTVTAAVIGACVAAILMLIVVARYAPPTHLPPTPR